jgi:hypothetical protein
MRDLRNQFWWATTQTGSSDPQEVGSIERRKARVESPLQIFVARQSVFSVISALAATILFLTLVIDVIFHFGPAGPAELTVLFFLLSAAFALAPLVVGRNYARWAGLIPVSLIAMATVYFIGFSGGSQSVVSSL